MKKGIYCTILALVLTASVFILPLVNPGQPAGNGDSGHLEKSPVAITEKKGEPSGTPEIDAPKSDETVTFIIETDGISLCETAASARNKYENVTALIRSSDIRQYTDMIKKNQAVVKASVRRMVPSADLDDCYTYNTVINGFSLKAPYSSLSKLQGISGVKSVTLASARKIRVSDIDEEEDITPQISDETTADAAEEKTDNKETEIRKSDYTAPQKEITGIDSAYESGFTGKGSLAVVIDDGFSCGHEVFSYAPDKKKYTADDISSLTGAVPFNTAENDSPFVSGKIAFAYDYAGRDNDLKNPSSDHGTGMASVLAGNNGKENEDQYRSGAFDSQLALMKVCSDGETVIGDEVILAALDDAAKLSPDVVSLSLGVPRTSTAAELFTRVFSALYNNGSFIAAAAGNNAININTDVSDGVNSLYTDYGTVSYPSSLSFITSVGSSESKKHYGNYLSVNDDRKIEYSDLLDSGSGESPLFSEVSKKTPYVYTNSYGNADDLWKFEPRNKIIIVKRGEISVEEKIKAARTVNAAGLIIISDEPLYIRFTAPERKIPAAVVGSSALEYFTEHDKGMLFAAEKTGSFDCENGGKVSGFSSYGVSSELRLKPDILAPGTYNYAASSDGYDLYTGTSVSCAQTAAAAVLLSEYASKYEKKDRQQVVNALMMNSAEKTTRGKGLYDSPRRQGAGILNIEKALGSGAYVISPDGSAGISMGDSETGEFSFGMIIKSISDKEQTFRISATTQTDNIKKENDTSINTLVPENITKNTEISFSSDGKAVKEIKLSPGESVSLDVDMKLKPAALISYLSKAPNGFYLDGFITLTETDSSVSLSVPLTGYCGNWELADIFDVSLYDDSEGAVIGGTSLTAAAASGNYYPGITIGKNATDGKMHKDKLCIGRDTVRNAFDMPSSGVSFVIPNFYLLRDAADFTITIKDSSQKNIFSRNIGIISSFTAGGYEPYAELLRSFNSDGLKNAFASMKEGNYSYIVSASAVSANSGASVPQSVSYDIIVDNTVPSRPVTKTYSDGNRVYLDAESTDKNGIQGFVLYTAVLSGGRYTYSDKLDDLIAGNYMDEDSYFLVSTKETATGATYTYDITRLYNQLKRVKAYAESEKDIGSFTELKLAVRSIDYAYNLSPAVAADSIVTGKLTYHMTDQNGKPVQGVALAFNGNTKTSGGDGTIVFDNVIPGYYGVTMTNVPDEYKTSFTAEAVFTDIGKTDYEKTISFTFTGEYPEEEQSSETPTADESSKKTEQQKNEISSGKKDAKDYFENDNSIFALIFVGVLVIITIASLAISRKKRDTFRGKTVSLKKPPRNDPDGIEKMNDREN